MHGGAVAADPEGSRAPSRDPAFEQALSHANCGVGGWDGGWRIVAGDARQATISRWGVRVRVRLDELGLADGTTGDTVGMRRPKELRHRAPGFYIAIGDADRPADGPRVHARVYFHLAPAGAVALVAAATRELNRAGVSFDLKILTDPGAFTRCDAGVLYLDAREFDRACGPLRAIVAACAPHLRSGRPAFTGFLAPGVGYGEHVPDDRSSFGTSRCRLVAEAFVPAARTRRPAQLLDAVAERFARAGLDLDAPYAAGESLASAGL